MTRGEAIDYVSRLQGEKDTAYNQILGVLAQAATANNQQQAPVPQPEPAFDHTLFDTDPAEAVRLLEERQANRVAQIAQQYGQAIFPQVATASRLASRSNAEYQDVWDKYAEEIDREVSVLPPQHRTEVAYNRAAEMVAGRHRKDLIDSEVQRRMSSSPGVVRGDGSDSGAPASDGREAMWQKLEDHPVGKRLLANGRASFVEFARGIGKTPEAYAETVLGSKTVDNGHYTTTEVM